MKITPHSSVDAAQKSDQVMACRLRDGRFTDPFVLAEVDISNDDICITNVSRSGISFVSTDIIDASEGKANIYHITIPFVKCANIISFSCSSTFLYPGDNATFELTVRNDGNTFLRGFDVLLREKGSKWIASFTRLNFGADKLMESSFNPMENGKLKGVEPDYSLASGKMSVYKISIKIPGGWIGTKQVCLEAVNLLAVETKSMRVAFVEPMLIPNSDADGEGYVEFYDGDPLASYLFDDSEAIEYVVGTNESDYDSYYEEDAGEPYDEINVEGECVFFDDDDYDDRIVEEGGDGSGYGGGGDYDVQLEDAPILLRSASDKATPSEQIPGNHTPGNKTSEDASPGGQTDVWHQGPSAGLYPEGRPYAYRTPAWGSDRTYAYPAPSGGQAAAAGSAPSGPTPPGQTTAVQAPAGQTPTVGQTPAAVPATPGQTTAVQTPATGSTASAHTPAQAASTTGRTLPGTGDVVGGLASGVATAMAAAGAAFMMYSARRVANENAAAQKDGEDEERM